MQSSEINEEVRRFLDEDMGSGDLTSALLPEETRAVAEIITREPLVMCGMEWVEAVFFCLDAKVRISWFINDGEDAEAGQRLCRISGRAGPLLTAERTALNILQTMSATATLSRRYARAVEGTGCRILDTRKTLPGLRKMQKYAVQCGGCMNHRIGLFDGILIKENHITAVGSITAAVRKARQTASVLLEVEVENLEELQEALDAGPDRIMLDNFSLPDLRQAVALTAGRTALEASGNIGLDELRVIAATGVDYISIGALTKNITAIDLSMRINLED